MPTVLVSSKCDNPPSSWEVDACRMEGFCDGLEGVESFQTSATAPETHKRCVSIILRIITSERSGKHRCYHPIPNDFPISPISRDMSHPNHLIHECDRDCLQPIADFEQGVQSPFNRTARARALTASQSSGSNSAGPTTATKTKHVRATSERPFLMSRDNVLNSAGLTLTEPGGLPRLNDYIAKNHQSPSLKSPNTDLMGQTWRGALQNQDNDNEGYQRPRKPSSITDDAEDRKSEGSSTSISQQQHSEIGQGAMSITDSFLHIKDEHVGQVRDNSESPDAIVHDESKDIGFSFDNLVDRLLAQATSKADIKYAAIFLCFYRKFAAPSELMSAIIHRFQSLNNSSHPQISRTTSQLRYLAVLAQWISDYPGDFAHPQTRRVATHFISGLSSSRAFAVAAKEIGMCLEVVSEDDDTTWACSDNSRSRANTVENFLSMSSVQSTASTLNADSSTEDISAAAKTDVAPKQHQARSSATPSFSSSVGRSGNPSIGSFPTLLNSAENAQRPAQHLNPTQKNVLTKIQWHQLMETADEDVARELTRIDWIMFSSIRPRDLVRHVSLSGHEKERWKSLEHVNRMIEQFNHVAFWVANMILLRDKPKHRAKMLEKFMSIAWVSQVDVWADYGLT